MKFIYLFAIAASTSFTSSCKQRVVRPSALADAEIYKDKQATLVWSASGGGQKLICVANCGENRVNELQKFDGNEGRLAVCLNGDLSKIKVNFADKIPDVFERYMTPTEQEPAGRFVSIDLETLKKDEGHKQLGIDISDFLDKSKTTLDYVRFKAGTGSPPNIPGFNERATQQELEATKAVEDLCVRNFNVQLADQKPVVVTQNIKTSNKTQGPQPAQAEDTMNIYCQTELSGHSILEDNISLFFKSPPMYYKHRKYFRTIVPISKNEPISSDLYEKFTCPKSIEKKIRDEEMKFWLNHNCNTFWDHFTENTIKWSAKSDCDCARNPKYFYKTVDCSVGGTELKPQELQNLKKQR